MIPVQLIDEKGRRFGVQHIGNKPVVVADSMNMAIARGEVDGTSFVHKFGKAPDFDIDAGFVTVWDGANDALTGTGSSLAYNYSSTADISQLSSTAADAVDIEIQGLDANWNLKVQTVTLNGTTPVTLTIPLIRVFRMKNVGATNLAGTVHLSIAGAGLTAGEPDALGDNRALITIGHNQTLMAVYTVPAGKTAYMQSLHVSLAGARKTSAHVFHLEIRPVGQVFQTKHTGAIIAVGTSHINHRFDIPEVIPEKSDIEMHVNTDEDEAAVSAGFDLVLIDN